MSDLIDREKAVRSLLDLQSDVREWDIGYFYHKIIQRCIDAVIQVPSAEPNDCYDCPNCEWTETIIQESKEPQWIPCSERMPEKCGLYLVSGGDKVWICELAQMMTVFGWVNNVANPRVTAWMPLPEPYKGDNDA